MDDQELDDLLIAGEHTGAARGGGAGVPPIVGREGELAEMRLLLAGNRLDALLFSGEPGVGKTRLLDEAAELAGRSGWRVVRGGCRPRAGDPYAPLTEAVAASLRGLPEREREPAVRASGRLDLLLPELARNGDARGGTEFPDELSSAPAHSERERRLLFGAVRDYLSAVAGEAGTLLVLDDLQWAGQDALELLAVIAEAGTTGARRPTASG